jgi:hypothetical protein
MPRQSASPLRPRSRCGNVNCKRPGINSSNPLELGEKVRQFVLTASLPFLFAVSLLAGKNLADYPLQIQVIETHWHRHLHRYIGIEHVDGWGRGDVRDGDSIRGFDFIYSSAQPLQRTDGDTRYPAKWKKESLRMEMLVGEIGASDKYQTYDLKTSVREDVYVPGSGGAIAISQQEYKDKWAK